MAFPVRLTRAVLKLLGRFGSFKLFFTSIMFCAILLLVDPNNINNYQIKHRAQHLGKDQGISLLSLLHHLSSRQWVLRRALNRETPKSLASPNRVESSPLEADSLLITLSLLGKPMQSMGISAAFLRSRHLPRVTIQMGEHTPTWR